MDIKELTKAEEQVMQILWEIKKGFVKEVIEKMPEPKPAYNTVSTIIRILEKKGFVGYNSFGKTHEYFPLIAKDEYRSFFLRNFMGNYFLNLKYIYITTMCYATYVVHIIFFT